MASPRVSPAGSSISPSGSGSVEATRNPADSPLAGEVGRLCNLAGERYALSDREREVAALVVRGRSVQSIAEDMVVSQNTIKTHVSRIYRKCGVHSREELVRLVEGLGE